MLGTEGERSNITENTKVSSGFPPCDHYIADDYDDAYDHQGPAQFTVWIGLIYMNIDTVFLLLFLQAFFRAQTSPVVTEDILYEAGSLLSYLGDVMIICF